MMTATKIHLPTTTTLDEWKTIAACVVNVLLDSNETEDIITAEELAARSQIAYLRSCGLMDTGEGPDIMRERPDLGDVDMDALRALPASTLGGAFARFFDNNKLTMKLYSVPALFTPDPDEAYLMCRYRHSHDIWHVLMDLSVEGHDEILLHAFSLPQSGMPSSVALMALGSLKHMLLEGRFGLMRTGLLAAYRRGRDASALLPVYWERHFEEDLDDVRARYGVRPWTAVDREAAQPWRWAGPVAA
jgi:ubiquinone biosynthesis protein COQ4